MLKKFVASLLLALVLLISAITPYAYAQETSPWYMQDFKQWYTKVYDTNVSPPQEIFGERYTAAQVQWVMYSLIAFLLNVKKDTSGFACVFSSGDVDSCINQHPAFGYIPPTLREDKSMWATLFPEGRQLSGVNYIRSKLVDIHIIPRAYAQGVGFTALGPIQNVWRVFRDIMYGFFVLIIIVYAFMIMFRSKISPQTVVTVQSALPKIIITLILVTFSYAIAGFLIDLMYVVMGILALVLTQIGFLQGVSWSRMFEFLTDGPGVVQGTGGIIGWFIGYWVPFSFALIGSVGQFMGSGDGLVDIAGIVGFVIALIAIVGLLLWLVVTVVRVLILLIRTYLSILISVIFAPFMIGFGAVLPAGGFSSWMRGIIANLAVYPIIGALMLLSVMFLAATYDGVRWAIGDWLEVPHNNIINIFATGPGTQFWYPPMTLGRQSGSWNPLPILWTFASLGILALIPRVTDIIKGLMSGKGIEGAGSGIGAAFGAIGGYAMGTARSGVSAYEYGQERRLAGVERVREAAHIRGYTLTEEAKMKEAYAQKAKIERLARIRRGLKI